MNVMHNPAADYDYGFRLHETGEGAWMGDHEEGYEDLNAAQQFGFERAERAYLIELGAA